MFTATERNHANTLQLKSVINRFKNVWLKIMRLENLKSNATIGSVFCKINDAWLRERWVAAWLGVLISVFFALLFFLLSLVTFFFFLFAFSFNIIYVYFFNFNISNIVCCSIFLCIHLYLKNKEKSIAEYIT